jgi:hypothetical protein
MTMHDLHDRGTSYWNEHESQDLGAEPVAALIFNFIRVVTTGRRLDAYAELICRELCG